MSNPTPPPGYETGVRDQLEAAVAAGDQVEAERAVDRVDADGYTELSDQLDADLQTTHLVDDPFTDAIVSDATRQAADRLAAISRWVDTHPANATRSPGELRWIRVAKILEEGGEAVDALNRATGANPRKGATGSFNEVSKELLDAAVTALAAYEHLNGNAAYSLAALFAHVEFLHERAGLPALDDSPR